MFISLPNGAGAFKSLWLLYSHLTWDKCPLYPFPLKTKPDVSGCKQVLCLQSTIWELNVGFFDFRCIKSCFYFDFYKTNSSERDFSHCSHIHAVLTWENSNLCPDISDDWLCSKVQTVRLMSVLFFDFLLVSTLLQLSEPSFGWMSQDRLDSSIRMHASCKLHWSESKSAVKKCDCMQLFYCLYWQNTENKQENEGAVSYGHNLSTQLMIAEGFTGSTIKLSSVHSNRKSAGCYIIKNKHFFLKKFIQLLPTLLGKLF